MDDNHFTNPSIKKAYGFHSFNPEYGPNIFQPDGLDVAKSFGHSCPRNIDVIFWLLTIFICIFIIYLVQGYIADPSAHDVFLSPIAISLSALFAFVGVNKTIKRNKAIALESHAISAINTLWKTNDLTAISKDGKAQYKLNKSPSFHLAINKFRRLQKKIQSGLSKDKNEQKLAIALLGAYFAAGDFDEISSHIKATHTEWNELQGKYELDRQAIRKGLNEAERLCQSIFLGIYDEEAVRNQIGADLSASCTYLLSYIYTYREIHALRLISRQDILRSIPFAEKGQPYEAQEETHDLLYEYLEYYVYKWFYSDKPKPFCFFHNHIQCVYDNIEKLKELKWVNDKTGPFPPFLQLTIKNQNKFISIINGLPSESEIEP